MPLFSPMTAFLFLKIVTDFLGDEEKMPASPDCSVKPGVAWEPQGFVLACVL